MITLRNGVKCTARKIEPFEVIDNNIVRHHGMHRLPSITKTPFQELLSTIIQSNYQLTEGQFFDLVNKSLSLPSLKDNAKTFSSDDGDIINAYNDNARRFFESILAKKIINSFAIDESLKLNEFISEFKLFLISQYEKHGSSYLNAWKDSQEGKAVKEENLAHYRLLRSNLKVLNDDKHFSNGKLVLDLLDLHYLTHGLAYLNDYKTYHPTGYIKSYLENSQFYASANRGRIVGFGFNHQEPSLNLGIMRSIDKTPCDLRRPKLISTETRCPDRLYMIHPRIAREKASSWIHHAFSNPHNSMYVNGLSGSILLELNALIFFQKAKQIGLYNPQTPLIDDEDIEKNNFKLIKDYLLMVSSLFIYFEGGHCLSEILSVFALENVSDSIEAVLKQPKGTFLLHDAMINNTRVYALIKESLIETAKYQCHLDSLQKVHNELFSRYNHKIKLVLEEFKLKVNLIGAYSLKAKAAAEKLLALLEQERIKAFRKPTTLAINKFVEIAHHAITENIPILENDLKWKDYLLNLIKRIVNTLINFFTFNNNRSNLFFKPKRSDAVAAVKDLEYRLEF